MSIIRLPFPLKGVDRSWGYRNQPVLTCPDALNVRSYDAIGERARGGQRPGLRRLFIIEAPVVPSPSPSPSPSPEPECEQSILDLFDRVESPLAGDWEQFFSGGAPYASWVANGISALLSRGRHAQTINYYASCRWTTPMCSPDYIVTLSGVTAPSKNGDHVWIWLRFTDINNAYEAYWAKLSGAGKLFILRWAGGVATQLWTGNGPDNCVDDTLWARITGTTIEIGMGAYGGSVVDSALTDPGMVGFGAGNVAQLSGPFSVDVFEAV